MALAVSLGTMRVVTPHRPGVVGMDSAPLCGQSTGSGSDRGRGERAPPCGGPLELVVRTGPWRNLLLYLQ